MILIFKESNTFLRIYRKLGLGSFEGSEKIAAEVSCFMEENIVVFSKNNSGFMSPKFSKTRQIDIHVTVIH